VELTSEASPFSRWASPGFRRLATFRWLGAFRRLAANEFVYAL